MDKQRKNFSLVRELHQTRVVMMEEHALNAYRAQLLHNFNHHVALEDLELQPTERNYMLTLNAKTSAPTGLQFFNEQNVLVQETVDGEAVGENKLTEDEKRILMLELCGPVTRYGGACSYSSIGFRDLMLQNADDPSVVGLVLITDTPGGTAFALHDFAQGMAAWNAAGKRSIQWIDGSNFSAGVAMGCQCQKAIAMNRKDCVGCVGAMMAGWTTADGTVDADGNRFVYITAEQTPDKNLGFREAAEGKYELLQEEISHCAADFLDTIERCRPQIPAEQRTGKIYEAGTVIGTFLDGIGSLDDAIHYALTGEERWDTTADPLPHSEGAAPAEEPAETETTAAPAEEPAEEPAETETTAAPAEEPAEEPAETETTAAPAEEPAEEPAETEPAEEPAETETTAAPAEEPAEEPAETETTAAPAEEPAEEPAETEPAEEPAGTPATESTDAAADELATTLRDIRAALAAMQAQAEQARQEAAQAQEARQAAQAEAEAQRQAAQAAEAQRQAAERAAQEARQAAEAMSSRPNPAPVPAAPAAARPEPQNRIHEGMTLAEKAAAYKRRGEELRRRR